MILEAQIDTVRTMECRRVVGRVAALRGLTVLVEDLPLPVGSLVHVESQTTNPSNPTRARYGEIVGFDGDRAVIMMLASSLGIRAKDRVVGVSERRTIGASAELLGRCINALGEPIDGGPAIASTIPVALDPEPTPAVQRARINRPLLTGVRAIDLMTTLGQGQRIGVMAGAGVGKSTLLGMIARRSSADVSVIALVGERGREVREFIEECLGEAGIKRSVVVVATSDESPLMRVRAAQAASAIAEYFRDRGQHVLLMIDSITRFAHAQRQIGLSAGEPPATKGYTPSVFAAMARLLERAGTAGEHAGTVTGIYSVLVEGDDIADPVTDASRGILDGHISLSRKLAQRGHFPSIDILDSMSRLADAVTDDVQQAARQQIVSIMAAYRDIEELHRIGAYVRGTSPEADIGIEYQRAIAELLTQARDGDVEPFDETRSRLVKLAMETGNQIAALTRANAARQA